MPISHNNRGKLTRRQTLKLAGGATAASVFAINHAWSKDVSYSGETFDAEGASITIGEWGGFWEENVRKLLLDDFEKDFNCKINYDSSFPWFPKFVASGSKDPAYTVTNWNLPELNKTARAGDYFLPQEDVIANVPNAEGLWPFALANGIGLTWLFGRYCYAYRTDLADPAPEDFAAFWQKQFAGNRGSYVTSNTLFMTFFMTSSAVFGADQYDKEAGFRAMRDAVPMKISDFTGNMQTLLERGEVSIAVQSDGEVYSQNARGVPVEAYLWQKAKPIITQTKTISRYSEPVEKKLAFALVNRTLDPEHLSKFGNIFYLRPTHRDVEVGENLAKYGVKNHAEATEGLWVPDWNWYIDNETEIVETVNDIISK